MTRYEDLARAAAGKFRDENGLGIAPVADLVALIEQTQNADVTVLCVESDDEHGLTMVDPQRNAVIVAVASSASPMRWRSTLAHELGHLVFDDHAEGQPTSLAESSPTEERAQSFARHLLLPVAALERYVDKRGPLTLSVFSDLIQRYQISPAMAAIQLRDAGYLDDDRYVSWSRMFTPSLAARFGWMDQYRALQGESGQRRAPQRLLARAVAGYVAGLITIDTVAGIRGIPVPDLEAEFKNAGITPADPDVPTAPASEADLDNAGHFLDLSWLDEP